MIDGISERLIDTQEHGPRTPFAASYRANAACARELGRLHDAVADGLTAWAAGGVTEKPVVRRSPARCLVQLGPVALTIAWLQSGRGTVADGELLVVVWRGAVASRSPRGFERSGDRAGPSSATALWEEVLVVEAESEDSWTWSSSGRHDGAMTSLTLADRCVERLREAYLAGDTET